MGIQQIRLAQIKANLPGYLDFEQQLIAMFGDSDDFEKIVAIDGQTIFTLQRNFRVGRNALKVYVNGILQLQDSSMGYTELNSRMIAFSGPLDAGDIVVVLYNNFKKFASGMGESRVSAYEIYRSQELITAFNATKRTFDAPHIYQKGLNQIKVWRNGVLLAQGSSFDYVELNGTQVQLTKDPKVGDSYIVEVIAGGLNVYKCDRYPIFMDTNKINQKIFTVPTTYKVNGNNLKVYLNGVLLRNGMENDYVEMSTTSVKLNDSLVVLPGSTLEFEVTTFTVDVFDIFRISRVFTDTDNTDLTIATTAPYEVGKYNLRLYLNGIMLRDGATEDYTEIDANTFKLNAPSVKPGTILEYEIISW